MPDNLKRQRRETCYLGHPYDAVNTRGQPYCKACARAAEARCRLRTRGDDARPEMGQ